LAIEILCSLLSGGSTSYEIGPHGFSYSHAIIVINPNFFDGEANLRSRSKILFDQIKKTDSNKTRIPGERGFESKMKNSKVLKVENDFINYIDSLHGDILI